MTRRPDGTEWLRKKCIFPIFPMCPAYPVVKKNSTYSPLLKISRRDAEGAEYAEITSKQ